MTKLICEIFGSTRIAEMYLFVEKREGFARVPKALLDRFGKSRSIMTLLLTPEKQLAQADINKVLKGIEEQGYYLQMPAKQDDYMSDIARANSKLNGLT